MAEDQNSSQERTEEPSQRKLEKAKKDGEVPRSRELVTTCMFLGGVSAIMAFSPFMSGKFQQLFTQNLDLRPEILLDTSHMARHLGESVLMGISALLPVFAVILFSVLVGSLLMGGWAFSHKQYQPKISRISPIQGIKRIFSIRSLVELFKSILKVSLVVGTLVLVIVNEWPELISLNRQSVRPALMHSLMLAGTGVLTYAFALALIAVIDIPFQKWQHVKKLRMTKQELKDEQKDTDGRPELKSRIRDIQREQANRRMMQEVPKADVIIRNPTHYAVALKYDSQKAKAPFVIARGVDDIAMKIIEVANAHERPVVQSPALTRAIYYSTKLNQEVAADLYMAIAQILAYVYRLRQFSAGLGPEPTPLPNEFDIPSHLRR
ncbi:flagellar biosynthesis protein FlhB [Parendozoicomonas sp. Alg238-R29]|uniref:flagellar biosynthesis protein FlhB n=1 Tax=Parendozoicomonas sp. Alg238-R29 TaxID=2993446 RepID=UPI00248DB424|nr:flagellar biosynthesis protein FlhB [Parendozoicomonas sp. Alg238-R29]